MLSSISIRQKQIYYGSPIRKGWESQNFLICILTSLVSLSMTITWDLESPFSKEEIDKVVADLPNNKSPGPDGFNGEFMKKCWPLIARGFL